MGRPAAKQGDKVQALDTHTIVSGGASAPVPGHPFNGLIDGALSSNVTIERRAAATVDSTATNTPRHLPIGGTFATPPSNKGRIVSGSGTVRINGKAAARHGDTAETCNDPKDLPVGVVSAISKVVIGG